VLTNLPSDDAEGQLRNAAFLQGLQTGWTVDRNLRIDFRWGTRGAMPTACAQRGGIGRAGAGRHPGRGHHIPGSNATGDPRRADRVRAGFRSGRGRFRCKPGAPGGNITGFTLLEYGFSEMAGAAQGDRAGRPGRQSCGIPAILPGPVSSAPSRPWRRPCGGT
jgi:hypothetical protein